MPGRAGARDVLREAPGDSAESGSELRARGGAHGPDGAGVPVSGGEPSGPGGSGPGGAVSAELRTALELIDAGVALYSWDQRLLFKNRTWSDRLGGLALDSLVETGAVTRPRGGALPSSFGGLLERAATGLPLLSARWERSRGEGAGGLGSGTNDLSEVFELTVKPFTLGSARPGGSVPSSTTPGAPQALLVQARDATARRRAERGKRETEALLGAIFETACVGLCLCDQRGRFVSVNRGYCEIFAYRPEELIGRHYSKVVPPEEREHAEALFQSFLNGQNGQSNGSGHGHSGHGQNGSGNGHQNGAAAYLPAGLGTASGPGAARAPVEMRGRRKDGAVLYNVVSSSLLISEDGRRYVVWSVLDITERKEHAELLAEQALTAQREAAEKTALLETLDRRLELIERQHQQILELSAPILDLSERVVALPLIGTLDGERAATITERLLGAVVERRARYVLLDLTSVQSVDRACAESLLRIVHAVRLLGARALLTGLTTQAATELAQLDVNLGQLPALPSLKEGLRACLGR